MRFIYRFSGVGIASVVLLAASYTANADSRPAATPRSFDALWQELQNANPALAAVAAERALAAGEEIQARLRPNPQLQLSTENVGVSAREDTLAIAQTMELGGKRAARIALASTQRDLARALLAQKRAELHAELRAAFYGLLGAQARLALAEDNLALARQDADSVKHQIAAGRLAPLTATRAEIELTNARLLAVRERTELRRAQRSLAALLGNRSLKLTVVGALDILPVVPPLDMLRQSLRMAPALAAATLETTRRGAQVHVEESRRYGDLTVTAGLRYMNELRQPAGVRMVSIPLPLSNRNQGNVAQAQGAAEQAAALERATELELAHDLDDAYLRFELAASCAADISKTVQPAAQATLDATSRGFALGKYGLIELLDARGVLLQSRSRLIDAQLDAQSALTDLVRVLGDERIAELW